MTDYEISEIQMGYSVKVRRMESGRYRLSFENGLGDEFYPTHDDVEARLDEMVQSTPNRGIEVDDDFRTNEIETGGRCGSAAGPIEWRN